MSPKRPNADLFLLMSRSRMLYSEIERSFSTSITRGGWRELRAKDAVSSFQNERAGQAYLVGE